MSYLDVAADIHHHVFPQTVLCIMVKVQEILQIISPPGESQGTLLHEMALRNYL